MNSLTSPRLSLSIVSHGQLALISHLLDDLVRISPPDIEVILTVNIPEDEPQIPQAAFPIRVIRNDTPKGFGANHNAAFQAARGEFFAVVNPDIRLRTLDLGCMLAPFSDATVATIAPVVLGNSGNVEDSVRRFPTFGRLLRRTLLKQRRPDYQWDIEPINVDWTAGMFVVFRSESFRIVKGFDDQRFFMYFEDVDICARMHENGLKVLLHPGVSVIHDARRDSHRSLKHLRWHLTSAARFLTGL